MLKQGMVCWFSASKDPFSMQTLRVYRNGWKKQRWKLEKGRPIRAIIFSAASVPFVDTTAVQGFKTMVEAFQRRHIGFLIANAAGSTMRIFLKVLGNTMPREPLESHWTVEECVAYFETQYRERLARLDASVSSIQFQQQEADKKRARNKYHSTQNMVKLGEDEDPLILKQASRHFSPNTYDKSIFHNLDIKS